jgi:hypothetical protein
MSPGRHHFAEMMKDPDYESPFQPGMNIWYGFFSLTGLDKAITKMFVFTPKDEIINTNPVKDSQSGTDQNNS